MAHKRCAYLTMDDTEGWAIDVDLAVPPLERLGWQVDAIRWRSDAPDWNRYEAVYVGVPWDYPEDAARFERLLDAIDRSQALLVNPLPLLSWSMNKRYLADLEVRGGPVVPSIWPEQVDLEQLRECFERWDTDRIVVKPVIGANAIDTFVLRAGDLAGTAGTLRQTFAEKAFFVQSYMNRVETDGEVSLFYFDGELSHAIRKIPAAGDFRVQEEYGADIRPLDPDDELRQAGRRVMSLVEPRPAYARVDLVVDRDGAYRVMELELVEPSLYLRMDRGAPERFARAFDRYVGQRREKSQ